MNRNLSVAEKVIKKYPIKPSSLISVLQDIQGELKHIPKEAIDAVSEQLKVPRSQVYSVASFYKCFSLTPLGKHQVDVCQGTACHVRGAGLLADQISEELGIKPGETTADGEITLNNVHCVGACALGPVAVIDGKFYGNMDFSKLSEAVKESCACKTAKKEEVVTEDLIPAVKLKDKNQLDDIRKTLKEKAPLDTKQILICTGTGCIASGSLEVAEKLKEELASANVNATVQLGVKSTGCHGLCEKGPLVIFHPKGLYYTKVKPEHVKDIVEKTVIKNKIIDELLYEDVVTGDKYENFSKIPFYAKQQKNVLRNVGIINPEEISDYITHDGYISISDVFANYKPEQVIDCVEKSGLRGCGGGGFATGKKWRSCVNAPGEVRYIICNGDEGDPGAFMDCSIMEGNPHAIIEGMIIGAYAIQSNQGYIYVREEYPRAVKRLTRAIKQAEKWGLLGDNILNSGFSFKININKGAGAFVCGESSALMQSIAGKVGEPRAKYVRSVERGLYDKPTVLNNVETYANIPLIFEKGAEWFSSIGTEKSKGTKAFSVVGKVKNTGLVEVPMGTTLRTIIFDICNGILNDKAFKAVQTGGPSGGCLPESKLDLEVDFDSLIKEGSMMGSGGMIVMDEDTCMVDVARYFIEFLTEESCGKCAACRLGLTSLKEILERICAGKGKPEDIPAMEKLFDVLDNSSLCGLGKSAANPVRSTLAHFLNEYEAHINDKKCPAKVCKALISYNIEDTCIGCGICLKACPQSAISGLAKEIHKIDQSLCDKCGICKSSCKFNAITIK